MSEYTFKICGSFAADSIWDPTSWPASDIPTTNTINKTTAKKRYFLGGDHLASVKSTRMRIQTFYGMTLTYSYSERDVQRRAWEVYGGPDGLKARQAQPQGFRAKWLTGAKATAYKEQRKTGIGGGAIRCDSQQTAAEPKPVRIGLSLGNRNSNEKSVSESIQVRNLSNKHKFHGDNIIELSSDDEFLDTSPRHYSQARWNLPAVVAPSPLTKKRCREEDVIVISSDDEGYNSPTKKKGRFGF